MPIRSLPLRATDWRSFSHSIALALASMALSLVFLIEHLLSPAGLNVPLAGIAIAFQVAFLLTLGRVDSLVFSVTFAFLYLFLIPCLSAFSVGIDNYVPLTIATFLLTGGLYLWRPAWRAPRETRGTAVPGFRFPTLVALCIGLLGFAALLLIVIPVGQRQLQMIALSTVYSLSLVVLDYACRYRRVLPTLGLILAHIALIGFFAAFYWDGFGRLYIFAYILMPLLIVNQHFDFGLRFWQVAIAAPAVLVFANFLRDGARVNLASLHQGSGGSHMTLTAELAGRSLDDVAPGWNAYFDQWLLLFFQWVPRELWADKPLGVGLTFVDSWIGRAGASQGHSIALSYLGEQMWLVGDYFLAGLAVTLLTLAALRWLVSRLSYATFAPVIAFDVALLTYSWGGMASMGARVWFFVLPMLAMSFMLHRLRTEAPKSVGRVRL